MERTRLGLCLGLVGVVIFLGCEENSAIPAPIDATSIDTGSAACSADSQCDDGVFCNGQESCSSGRCADGARPDCDDGVACTRDICNEERARCDNRAVDVDQDGYGDGNCRDSAGASLGNDCNDADARAYPGNLEVCDLDGHDEDCNPNTFGVTDGDGDHFVDQTCRNTEPSGTVHAGDDCDDARRTTNPAGVEVCNQLDDDCDGTVDEGVRVTLFQDQDRDGHGSPAVTESRCADATGWSTLNDDCDDHNVARHGSQLELCDAVDNDCDNIVDENPQEVDWFRDEDGDGFGASSSGTRRSCAPQAGYSLLNTDCDDSRGSANPAAQELCNAIDDDCNGRADYSIRTNDLEDDDQDGLADIHCTPNGTDCDDRDPESGAPSDAEICDGRDNDCDDSIDEGALGRVFYRDVDGDGFGGFASGSMVGCMPHSGYVSGSGDCDDNNPSRRPGGVETCNAQDDDCDGAVDNAPASSMCSLANASSVCVSGSCLILECSSRFADCDGLASSGCESDTRIDMKNCGSCGTACGGPHVLNAMCVGSMCAVTCAAGWLDCDGNPSNGCEVSSDGDSFNCGGCGITCIPGSRQFASCGGGQCIYGCSPGYGDCDHNPINGCEAILNTSTNCGSCGNSCSNNNAISTCAGDRCNIACSGGFGNCDGNDSNGCETMLNTTSNCGMCGRMCDGAGAHAASICSMGACVTDTNMCTPGWGNCDGDPNNGCETSLMQAQACGSCMINCNTMFPNAQGTCIGAAMCSMGTCFPNWGNCDNNPSNGCERSLNTASDCGNCGATCTLPNASEMCDNGACRVSFCDPGWGDCNGNSPDGCEQALNLPTNCGACGKTCGAGGVCIGSSVGGVCDEVVDVVTGAKHTCARRSGGKAACWGADDQSQLGDALSMSSNVPVEVEFAPGISVLQLSAGADHTCAIATTGLSVKVFCWGDNQFGQLASGSFADIATPQEIVFSGAPVGYPVQIECGFNHSCVLMSSGEVWCWGQNTAGETGQSGFGVNRDRAFLVNGFSGTPIELAAGDEFTCARTNSSTGVECWGSNAFIQLGSTTVPLNSATNLPTPLTSTPMGFDGPNLRQIVSGRHHTCVRNANNSMACWGDNGFGQLGNGMSSGSPNAPILSTAFASVTAVAAGDTFTCARTTLNRLGCVGRNNSGQMGNGNLMDAIFSAVAPAPLGPGSFFVAETVIANGPATSHMCAVDYSTHSLYCWGQNSFGQVGNMNISPSQQTPIKVAGMP